jgi:hypothetical protein
MSTLSRSVRNRPCPVITTRGHPAWRGGFLGLSIHSLDNPDMKTSPGGRCEIKK